MSVSLSKCAVIDYGIILRNIFPRGIVIERRYAVKERKVAFSA